MKLFIKNKAVYILAAIIIFSSFCSAVSAKDFDTTLARILQTKIEELKVANNLKGISAAALIPMQGLWTGTSGISSETQNVTPDMVFGAGSITKNFVAAIVLHLIEADSLSLNDILGRWLPHYDNINGAITIKQLLNHTSGIYNYTESPAFGNAINQNLNRLWDQEEFLTSEFILAPYFAPGTSWHYSNTNFLLLGLIIRRIMGTNLSSELRYWIFDPFYLDECFLETQETVKAPFCHNWVDLNGDGILDDADFLPRTAIYSAALAAGAVVSRPENLVRWLYSLYLGKFLSQASLDQMTTFVPLSGSGINGYGLGTMRYIVNGRTCYGHGGNIFGFTSVMIFDPEDSLSIAIMMNKDLNGTAIGKSFMATVMANNPVGVTTTTSVVPEKYFLNQNFPNPFNPVTNLAFGISDLGFVTLKIYDMLGREVAVIVNSELVPGTYNYDFDASNLNSGIYFYTLNVNSKEKGGEFSQTKKMLLVK